jgi:zeaxanthin glucosyltransferase
MTHFGVICPSVPGHLIPTCALGRELMKRGHRVTMIASPDSESKILEQGIDCAYIGEKEYPPGSLIQFYDALGAASGLEALRLTVDKLAEKAQVLCRDAPGVIQKLGIEVLLADQVESTGATLSEAMGIPFVSLCCALSLNRESAVPPFFTAWNYQDSWIGHTRNRAGLAAMDYLFNPVRKVLVAFRRDRGLSVRQEDHSDDTFSKLAQISQQVPEFDFPRRELPNCFHYVGPMRNTSPQTVDFPYNRLDGRPLVYASLGTLQNRNLEIFRTIAKACAELNVQLVLSLGRSNAEALGQLPGAPLVVSYAPQEDLLKRAALTITHAGLNTVLESLSCGVPMVAIPITNDQPGVGARIRWTGSGEVVPLAKLGVPSLNNAIRRVLEEQSYRVSARKIQQAIQRSGGVQQAADIIETVVQTGKPLVARSTTS